MSSTNLQLGRTWQIAAYLTLALAALIFTIILLPSSAAHFRRFFGGVHPIVVVLAATVLGALALWRLGSGHGFVLLTGRQTLRGVALSAALATVLAVAIVIADSIIRYPQDMNVPLPQAWLFYPAIGFVAEIVFHIVPLALLLLLLSPLGGSIGAERVVWIGILLVAALEPTFHVLSEGKPFTWGSAYTWIHVFAIAFLQLAVFRRYDFASMYSFRLVYYLYWHILWGVIRLRVLF